MSKVTWVIENYAKEESFEHLIGAARNSQHTLIEINGDYTKTLVSSLKTPQCVICNGSIKMVKLLYDELIPYCWPIRYCNFESFKCSHYYSHFGSYLFNDKYCLMSLAELNRQKFNIWGNYGKDALIFIRPDSGEKTFQAGLLDIIDLHKLMDNNKEFQHDLMLISTPKNIRWEGRFIVSKYNEIISYSTYRIQGQVAKIPSVPPKSIDFVKELLKINYYPDSVFCYDVCEDNDGNFWLLELTSFSSAGLYASNKDRIIERVSEIALIDYKNYQTNKQEITI